jgi:dienelactone hydrolase
MYWHGGYGHRREMAAMCVLLSTRGFVVAAPDFPGDHITKMYGKDPEVATKPVDASAEARPNQAAEIIELLLASGDQFLRSVLNGENVGSFGLSLGGFTTLAVNSSSDRLKASFAIAPACGTRSPLPQMERIAKFYRLDECKSPAATFLLTGDADALVIVDDVREMFAQLPEPKKLAVLKEAGHLHWTDNAELMHETLRLRYLSGEFPDPELDGQKLGTAFRPFAELCPAEHALDVMRSTILAHFEASLKGNADARTFLDNDLAETFAARGIDLDVPTAKHEAAGA